jgi:hypothetical protein
LGFVAIAAVLVAASAWATKGVLWVPLRGQNIAFRGTPEYEEVTGEFAYTLEEAVEAMRRYDPKAYGHHCMIVDGHYVFTTLEKSVVPRRGYYVDGSNGIVEERWDVEPASIPVDQARWMGYSSENLLRPKELF